MKNPLENVVASRLARRHAAVTPYTVNTWTHLPPAGIDERTGVLVLLRGLYASPVAPSLVTHRNRLAETLNAVVLESSYYLTEYTYAPSDLASYRPDSRTGELLRAAGLDGTVDLRSMVLTCAAAGHVPVLFNQPQEPPPGIEHLFLFQALDVLSGMADALDRLRPRFTAGLPAPVICGHSYGGNLAHLCLRLAPRLFRGLVDDSSITRPEARGQVRQLGRVIHKHKAEFRIDMGDWNSRADPEPFDRDPSEWAAETGTVPKLLYTCAGDKVSGLAAKRRLVKQLPAAELRVADKRNGYLGLYRPGRHADSDRFKLIGDAWSRLEASGEQRLDAGWPKLSFATERYRYAIDGWWREAMELDVRPGARRVE